VYLWKALWPILFGVLLTAGIDAFVDQDRLAGLLGGRDPGTTARAGLFGALSSACTFGAVTVAHSLFKKGASAESTFAFSFGATNLVVELGVLIYVLMGPAFLAAELVGGVVLVAIMYLIVRATLPEA
ncbi:MAG: permease, partial [Gemmatimonadota bacterium]